MWFSAVAFDLDNTLFNWGRDARAVFSLVRAGALGVLPLITHTERLRGTRQTGPNEKLLPYATKQNWAQCYVPSRIPRQMKELLLHLQEERMPLALISDHPSIEKLQHLGLLSRFSTLVDCSGIGALKPLPDAIQHACANLGVHPSELLFIGDRAETDGGAAHAAGCAFVSVEHLGKCIPVNRIKRIRQTHPRA